MNDNMIKLMRALDGIDDKYIVDAAAPLMRGTDAAAAPAPVSDAPTLSAVAASMEAPAEKPEIPEQPVQPAAQEQPAEEPAEEAAPAAASVHILPPPTEKSLAKADKKKPGSARILGKRMLALIIAAATLLTLLAATGITAAAVDAGSPLEKTAAALMPEVGILCDVLSDGGSFGVRATLDSDILGMDLPHGPIGMKLSADVDKKGSMRFDAVLKNDETDVSAELIRVGDNVQLISGDVIDVDGRDKVNIRLSTLLDDLAGSVFAPDSGSELAMDKEEYDSLTSLIRTVTDNLDVNGEKEKKKDKDAESGEALTAALAAIADDMKDAVRPRKFLKSVTVRGERVMTSAAAYTVDGETVRALCESVRVHLIHNPLLLKSQFDDESILSLLTSARSLVSELETFLGEGGICGELTVCTKSGCLILCEMELNLWEGDSEADADNAERLTGRVETSANPAKDRRLDVSLEAYETTDGDEVNVLSLSASYQGTVTRQSASFTMMQRVKDMGQISCFTTRFEADMNISHDSRYNLTLNGVQAVAVGEDADPEGPDAVPTLDLIIGGKWKADAKGFSVSLDRLAVSGGDDVSHGTTELLDGSEFAVVFSAKTPGSIRVYPGAEPFFSLSENELKNIGERLTTALDKLTEGASDIVEPATENPVAPVVTEAADRTLPANGILADDVSRPAQVPVDARPEAEITLDYMQAEPVFDAMPLHTTQDMPEFPNHIVDFLRYDEKTNTLLVTGCEWGPDGLEPVTVVHFYDADTLNEKIKPMTLKGIAAAFDAGDGYFMYILDPESDGKYRLVTVDIIAQSVIESVDMNEVGASAGTASLRYAGQKTVYVSVPGYPLMRHTYGQGEDFTVVDDRVMPDSPKLAYARDAGTPNGGSIIAVYTVNDHSEMRILNTANRDDVPTYVFSGLTEEIPYYDGCGFWHSGCGYLNPVTGEQTMPPIDSMKYSFFQPYTIPVYTYSTGDMNDSFGVVIERYTDSGAYEAGGPAHLGREIKGQTVFVSFTGDKFCILGKSIVTKSCAWDGKGQVFLVNYDQDTNKTSLAVYDFAHMYQDFLEPTFDPVTPTGMMEPDEAVTIPLLDEPDFDRMPLAQNAPVHDSIRYDESLNRVYIASSDDKKAVYEIRVYDGSDLSLLDVISGNGVILSMDADGGLLAYSVSEKNGIKLYVRDNTENAAYPQRTYTTGELFGSSRAILNITLHDGILIYTDDGVPVCRRRLDLTDGTVEKPMPENADSTKYMYESVSAYDPVHDRYLYVDTYNPNELPSMRVIDGAGKSYGSTRDFDGNTAEMPYFDGTGFWYSRAGFIDYQNKAADGYGSVPEAFDFMPLYNGQSCGAPSARISLTLRERVPDEDALRPRRYAQTVFHLADGTVMDALGTDKETLGLAMSSTGIVYMVVSDKTTGTVTLCRYDMTGLSGEPTDGDVDVTEIVPSVADDGIVSVHVPAAGSVRFDTMNGLPAGQGVTEGVWDTRWIRFDAESNRVFITGHAGDETAVYVYDAETTELVHVLRVEGKITSFDAYNGRLMYLIPGENDSFRVTMLDANTYAELWTLTEADIDRQNDRPVGVFVFRTRAAVLYDGGYVSVQDAATGKSVTYSFTAHRPAACADHKNGVLFMMSTHSVPDYLCAYNVETGGMNRGKDSFDAEEESVPYWNGRCFVVNGRGYNEKAVASDIYLTDDEGYFLLAYTQNCRLRERNGEVILTDKNNAALYTLSGTVSGVAFDDGKDVSCVYVIMRDTKTGEYRLNAFRIGK